MIQVHQVRWKRGATTRRTAIWPRHLLLVDQFKWVPDAGVTAWD